LEIGFVADCFFQLPQSDWVQFCSFETDSSFIKESLKDKDNTNDYIVQSSSGGDDKPISIQIKTVEQ